MGFSIIIPIMPLYAKSLGASSIIVGAIFAGFALSRGIFSPIMGRVSDQYGRKNLLMLGLGLYIVMAVAYAFAPSPLVLIAIRIAQGFASVLVTPIAQSYIGDITPEGREGEYMNLFYVSFFGGLAVGPVVGGYLSEAFSLETPFFFMAGMAVIALVVVAVVVPESSALSMSSDETTDAPETDLSLRESLTEVFNDRQMRGVMSYISARGFYRWGFNSFFPVFAVGAVALNRTQVGLVISGYMLTGAVLQYPLGRLSDTLSQHRTAFVVIGGSLSALTMIAVPLMQSLVPLVALVVAMGVFGAISRASTVAIRTERGRVHGMGAVTGAYMSSVSAGQVVGPLVFGVVVGTVGIQDAFYLGGVDGLVGTVGAYWFLHTAADRSGAAPVGAGSD